MLTSILKFVIATVVGCLLVAVAKFAVDMAMTDGVISINGVAVPILRDPASADTYQRLQDLILIFFGYGLGRFSASLFGGRGRPKDGADRG